MTKEIAPPRIPLLQYWRKALIPVLLTVATVSIAVNFFEARETDATLPAEIEFVPLDARVFVASPSVGTVLRNASAHFERTQVAGNPIGEYIEEFAKAWIFRNCLDFGDGDVLVLRGIDDLATLADDLVLI